MHAPVAFNDSAGFGFCGLCKVGGPRDAETFLSLLSMSSAPSVEFGQD